MNVCPKGLMVSSSHQINPVKETSSRSDVAKNGPRTAALPFARLRSWTASWRQLNAPSGSTVSVLHPLHGAAEKIPYRQPTWAQRREPALGIYNGNAHGHTFSNMHNFWFLYLFQVHGRSRAIVLRTRCAMKPHDEANTCGNTPQFANLPHKNWCRV